MSQLVQKLSELKTMLDGGLLTPEEFEAAKESLFASQETAKSSGLDYEIVSKILELLASEDSTLRDQGLGLLQGIEDAEVWDAVLKNSELKEVDHYGVTSVVFTDSVYSEHRGLFRAYCLNPHARHEGVETLSMEKFNGDFSADVAEVLSSIRHLGGLTELRLVRSADLVDLQELGVLPALKTLVIEHCQGLQSLKLSSLPQLETLIVRECRKLKRFDIGALPALKRLTVEDCGQLGDLDGIQGSTALEELTLLEVPKLASLESLASLEGVALSRARHSIQRALEDSVNRSSS